MGRRAPSAAYVPSSKTAERKASALVVHLNHASHNFHALAQLNTGSPNSTYNNTGGRVSVAPSDINY